MKNNYIQLTSPNTAFVYGFSYRKFKILKKFLPNTHLVRVRNLAQLPLHATVYVWGMQLTNIDLSQDVQVIRVEDGFLRSVGLGAALTPPVSWVFDALGMYFDTSSISSLEQILNTYSFDVALIERARQVQSLLIEHQISKYNLSTSQKTSLPTPSHLQRKILVIGQVEGDASLEYGSPKIKTNIELLKVVHQSREQELIVYRPHPDVFNGWRHDSLQHQHALKFCNLITTDGSILAWIDWADEVHVMTSLTGFEALIRNKLVYCYGLPFYAGWGLTQDRAVFSRAKRQLSLLELIAGTLIIYPQYRSILGNALIEVEDAITELLTLKQQKKIVWTQWLKLWLKRH